MDRHMKRRMDMHIRMSTRTKTYPNSSRVLPRQTKHSTTGTRTRVSRVRAESYNQLGYSGAGFQIIHHAIKLCVNIHKDTLETQSRDIFDHQPSSLCVYMCVCVCASHGPSRLCRACRISGHPESNQEPSDCCRSLQSDPLSTEL